MAEVGTPRITLNASAADVPGLELTAVFCNRFNVTLGAITTRIVFGEFVVGNPEKDSNFHTAVVVPTADALALARLIIALFEGNPQAKSVAEAFQASQKA
jgi:hypothetical protein